jgi:hypothetical protein
MQPEVEAMISPQALRKLALFLITVCGTSGALGQKPQDCRTKEDVPPVSGHWKDDQTGKEVDITELPSSNNILARYSEEHNCPYPDESGKPVPAPVDFDGTYTTKKFAGLIHVCRWKTDDKHPSAYTYKTDKVDLSLSMTDDGLKLQGHWHNPDTSRDEGISLTRLSKPEYPFRKYEHVRAGPNAKIHAQPRADSEVRYTPAAGRMLIIYAIEHDEAGNPTWYQVSDAATSVGSKNYGWIPANQVRCITSAKPSRSVG